MISLNRGDVSPAIIFIHRIGDLEVFNKIVKTVGVRHKIGIKDADKFSAGVADPERQPKGSAFVARSCGSVKMFKCYSGPYFNLGQSPTVPFCLF